MKPEGPVFDSALRARCMVMECGRSAISEFINKRHYLYSWPGVTVACYAILRDSIPVGACVFALPPAETSKRYGKIAWELARLWIDDSMPHNSESWFISQVISQLAKRKVRPEMLVSYADPSQKHTGIIYRASNWKLDGRTDQERKSARVDYVANGKKYSRRSHVPADITPTRVPRTSKFRFIYVLVSENRTK